MQDQALSSLRALAHEIRLSAFRMLIKTGAAGMAAGKIAEQLDVPASTLSSHLNQLEQAGLIYSRREQQKIIYAVNMDGTQSLLRFLLEDCCAGKPELCGYSLNKGGRTSHSRQYKTG